MNLIPNWTVMQELILMKKKLLYPNLSMTVLSQVIIEIDLL